MASNVSMFSLPCPMRQSTYWIAGFLGVHWFSRNSFFHIQVDILVFFLMHHYMMCSAHVDFDLSSESTSSAEDHKDLLVVSLMYSKDRQAVLHDILSGAFFCDWISLIVKDVILFLLFPSVCSLCHWWL